MKTKSSLFMYLMAVVWLTCYVAFEGFFNPSKQIMFRIIASLRLEKTSKIMQSNWQPNTTMPAEPCPEVPYLYVF